MNLNHFSLSEFDSPDLPNSGKNMDSNFLTKLEHAREIANIPFKITSGFRTQNYLQDLLDRGYKASKNSSHLVGKAADIAAVGSSTRFIIVNALLKAGFNRIGIDGNKNFIHVDSDGTDMGGTKPPNVIWTY